MKDYLVRLGINSSIQEYMCEVKAHDFDSAELQGIEMYRNDCVVANTQPEPVVYMAVSRI